ncbi:MAG TPA: hypothetical protein VGC01_08020 [Mucilaginibacter sp.]
MSDRFKKIFILLSIVVPFLLYCSYYYGMVLKDAPYKFTEFESMQFQYGPGDSLVNKYDSKTGGYQYINSKDSLVKMKLHLTKGELLYLHRKAADLGFWDFPENEVNGADSINAAGVKPTHYYIAFNYKRKSKKVLFDASFDGPQKLVEANGMVIKEIQKILDEAEARQKK